MTPEEKKQSASRVRVEAFERGQCGASVRELPLEGLAPLEAHEKLVRGGFRSHRFPIVGLRTRAGAPHFRAPQGYSTVAAEAASEYAYVHADGGIVRLYPGPAPFDAYAEVSRGPFARKSLLLPGRTTLTLADEACVVTEAGAAVPKALRPSVGLKFSPSAPSESHELAERILRSQLIRLAPGDAPPVAKHEGTGLAGGFTVFPASDFWKAAPRVRGLLEATTPPVLLRSREPDLQAFFTGAAATAAKLRTRPVHPALASLSFHGGSYAMSIDGFGYEASVEHLAATLAALFHLLPEAIVFENATGRDVTRLATRFPYKLLGAEGPILDGAT